MQKPNARSPKTSHGERCFKQQLERRRHYSKDDGAQDGETPDDREASDKGEKGKDNITKDRCVLRFALQRRPRRRIEFKLSGRKLVKYRLWQLRQSESAHCGQTNADVLLWRPGCHWQSAGQQVQTLLRHKLPPPRAWETSCHLGSEVAGRQAFSIPAGDPKGDTVLSPVITTKTEEHCSNGYLCDETARLLPVPPRRADQVFFHNGQRGVSGC